MQVNEADEIERRDSVPESEQTEERTKAADYIESEVLDEDRWPMTLTAISEETDWSRQHIKNTLEGYFEPVTTNDGGAVSAGGQDDADVSFESRTAAYRKGFKDGFREGLDEARRAYGPESGEGEDKG